MFETFTNLFDSAKSLVSDAYQWGKTTVHNAYDYVVGGTRTLLEAPKNIIKTVYSDARKLVSGANDDVNKILDRGSHTIDSVIGKTAAVITTGQQEIGTSVRSLGHDAGGAVQGLGQSLSTPMLVLGGIAAFFLLNK